MKNKEGFKPVKDALDGVLSVKYGSGQALIQICEDIFDVFDTHTHSY
jgi:hypothetical protein